MNQMPSEHVQMAFAVKARTALEEAKAELPEHVAKIEEARQLLWDGEYARAKAIVVGLFEHPHSGREHLGEALAFVMASLGEDDLGPLMKYMQRK